MPENDLTTHDELLDADMAWLTAIKQQAEIQGATADAVERALQGVTNRVLARYGLKGADRVEGQRIVRAPSEIPPEEEA